MRIPIFCVFSADFLVFWGTIRYNKAGQQREDKAYVFRKDRIPWVMYMQPCGLLQD